MTSFFVKFNNNIAKDVICVILLIAKITVARNSQSM